MAGDGPAGEGCGEPAAEDGEPDFACRESESRWRAVRGSDGVARAGAGGGASEDFAFAFLEAAGSWVDFLFAMVAAAVVQLSLEDGGELELD